MNDRRSAGSVHLKLTIMSMRSLLQSQQPVSGSV